MDRFDDGADSSDELLSNDARSESSPVEDDDELHVVWTGAALESERVGEDEAVRGVSGDSGKRPYD